MGKVRPRAGQGKGRAVPLRGERKQRLGLTGAGRAQTEAVSPDYHLPRIEYSAIRSIDMKWQINHVLSITINCQLDMISLFSFSSKLHLRNEAIPQPQKLSTNCSTLLCHNSARSVFYKLISVNDVRHANPSNLDMLCILSFPFPLPALVPLLLLFMFFAISL